LVGLPNAGKSSLLARMTRAAPKVADYPFTTVEPVLGTIDSDDGQLVLADIPGLIEGAAGGAGLGHEFLAHIERCRLIVHVVEIASEDPAAAYETVRSELDAYGGGLAQLPELVALSKCDLVPDADAARARAEWRERLGARVAGVLAVSAVTGAGIDQLRRAIFARALAAEEPSGPPVATQPEFELEHRVYRPAGAQGYRVVQLEDGVFRVEGRGVEMLARRYDPHNQEAMAYLEQRLREMGVVSALRSAGFAPGDEVQIGEASFELDPT
jgi:GTP-binding protein